MVTKKKTLTHGKNKESSNKSTQINKSKSQNNAQKTQLQSKLKSGVEDDLFICITDVLNKRKSLLNSLKISLLAQEECEVVHNLRSQKYEYLETLKKEINEINNLYSKLQRLFPNTKHVISYAEKELNDLDHQISLLNQSKEIEQNELDELETAKDEISEADESLEKREELIHQKTRNYHTKTQENVEDESNKKNSSKELSKLGRIQNNLQIIEEKLKHLG